VIVGKVQSRYSHIAPKYPRNTLGCFV
jgi:hypothetical protein